MSLRVITLFSGYDSQCLALNRLGVDYELVNWCEIDKHAIKAHNALFPQWADRNLGDISRVDWNTIPRPIDLLTYSSPCQDFSQAGLQRGGEKGSGTRSGLLWECEMAIETLRPKYLVFENVPALVSEKFMPTFIAWAKVLEGLGYHNYWQCLNAKHYGVPQNRNRVFMVSINGGGQQYFWPKPFKLERRLKDVLEQEVDERYYLSEKNIESLLAYNNDRESRGMGFRWEPLTGDEHVSKCVTAFAGSRQTDNYLQEQQVLGWTRNEKGNIIDRHPVDVANCVTSGKRDNTQNFVQECRIAAVRGRSNGEWHESEHFQKLEVGDNETSNNLTGVAKDNLLLEPAILTPTRTEEMKAERRAKGDNGGIKFGHHFEPRQDGCSNTVSTVSKDNMLAEPCIKQVGNLKPNRKGFSNPEEGRVFSSYGIAPTCGCCQGGNKVTKIVEEPVIIEDFYPSREPRHYKKYGPTLRSNHEVLKTIQGLRIRRLTERELYRLMDVSEPDIDTLLAAPIPRTQHAKLAGNSIVVACLYHIFNRLLVDTQPQRGEQMALF